LPAALLMLGLLLVPTTAAILIIHPRLHYLLPVICFAVALTGASLLRSPGLAGLRGRLEGWPVLLGVAGLLLAGPPNRAHGCGLPGLLAGPPVVQRPLPEQKTVAALRRLHLQGQIVVLGSAGWDRLFYAGVPGQMVWLPDKKDSFWQFVRQRGINVIILSPDMVNDVLLRDEPEFQDFVAGVCTGDFTLLPVPDTPVQIAVRNDVLPATTPARSASDGTRHPGAGAPGWKELAILPGRMRPSGSSGVRPP